MWPALPTRVMAFGCQREKMKGGLVREWSADLAVMSREGWGQTGEGGRQSGHGVLHPEGLALCLARGRCWEDGHSEGAQWHLWLGVVEPCSAPGVVDHIKILTFSFFQVGRSDSSAAWLFGLRDFCSRRLMWASCPGLLLTPQHTLWSLVWSVSLALPGPA